MENLEMNEGDTALILEAVYEDDARDICFRAITFEMDQETGARSVNDIAEADSIDVLRDHVKNKMRPTHYQSPRYGTSDRASKSDDAWGDALVVLKTKLHNVADEEGVLVSRSASPIKTCTAIRKMRANKMAQEIKRCEEADNLTHKDADYALAVTMRYAHSDVAAYPEKLAKHIEKLTADPHYTLGWCGDFVEATAKNVVAKWAVELFESGTSAKDMAEVAMDEMFSAGSRASSRSSSVMANLNDDCLRVAWAEIAKRLTGRAFW